MENYAKIVNSKLGTFSRAPTSTALLPGTRYNINPVSLLFMRVVVFGAFGVGATSAFTVKSLGVDHPGGLLNELFGVVFGLALIAWAVATLREPYAICITSFGALELKRFLGSVIIMPREIQMIRTATRKIREEGADARIIEITYRSGRISIGNFSGAEAVFTQLLSMYPHIRTETFDFTPDIRD